MTLTDITEQPIDLAAMAEYLRKSEYTTREYAKRGEIPGFKLNGRCHFYLSQVQADLTSRVVDPWQRKR